MESDSVIIIQPLDLNNEVLPLDQASKEWKNQQDRQRRKARTLRQERKCAGKRFYETEFSAIKAVDTHKREYRVTMYHYECQFCGMWHLTHRLPRATEGVEEIDGSQGE